MCQCLSDMIMQFIGSRMKVIRTWSNSGAAVSERLGKPGSEIRMASQLAPGMMPLLAALARSVRRLEIAVVGVLSHSVSLLKFSPQFSIIVSAVAGSSTHTATSSWAMLSQ